MRQDGTVWVLPRIFLLECSEKTFFILGLWDLKTHKLKLLLATFPSASSKNKTNARALRCKSKAKTRAHPNDIIKNQTSRYQSYFYPWNFDLCELIRSLFWLSYFDLTLYHFNWKGFQYTFTIQRKITVTIPAYYTIKSTLDYSDFLPSQRLIKILAEL